MNNKVKMSFILSALLAGISGPSYAQQVAAPTIGMPAKVSQGNAFEREVTPLLREISRKKTELELRKLDRELERLDEESLKAQLAAETPPNNGNAVPGIYNPFQTPNATPAALPATLPAPNGALGSGEASIEPTTDIKVLMISGFDSNLHAKVASGEQGGYVVKAKDILPNGQVVHKVTPNYIEVVRGINKKGEPIIQRIFLSAEVPSIIEGNQKPNAANNRVGNESSVRSSTARGPQSGVAGIVAPVASPGVHTR